jgi:hypothetical protein
MYPLKITGCLGEAVDFLLVDLDPVGQSDLLAFQRFGVVDCPDQVQYGFPLWNCVINVESERWFCTSLARQQIHRCQDQGKFCKHLILRDKAIERLKAFVSAVPTDWNMLHTYTPSNA